MTISATPSVCQPGAIVRHTGEFCRSIGWHTPPLDGIVVAVRDDSPTICTVWWCDEDAGDGHDILAGNLELHPENPHVSDSMRACLIDEYNAAQGVI